jgi:beta-lactam-binding protein with PASTA domain
VSSLVGGIPQGVDQLVRAATSRDPQLRHTDAGVFLRVTRALRGMPAAADSVAGAWAAPAVAGASPHGGANPPYAGAQSGGGGALAEPANGVDGLAPADAAGGSHTMVMGAGYPGHGEAAAGYNGGSGPGRPGSAFAAQLHGSDDIGPRGAGARHRGAGEREPFLQRWLFSSRLVYVLAGAVVLIGLGGGGWWLTSGRYTAVPAVGKLTATAAAQTLHAAGFHVRTGPSVIDDNVPKGEVISTSPSGRALPGATIVLTISQGPRMITVPQIPQGDSVAKARALLRKAGLTVAAKTEPVGVPSNPQLGAVAGTTPAEGTSQPENKPVVVNVVAGLALPDLVGQDIGTIQGWAGQNHINIQPTQVDSSQPQGTIVAQSPAPKTPVQPGQTVSVSVSNGPPMVPIPDVQGQSCQDAQQALQQAGFTNVNTQQGWFQQDKAFSTNPSGQAAAGTQITLQCGWGGF